MAQKKESFFLDKLLRLDDKFVFCHVSIIHSCNCSST